MGKEDYVSYDVAKLLKEKGYENDYETNRYGYYCDMPDSLRQENICDINYYTFLYAPSLYDAQKWLRETHNIKVMPQFFEDKNNYGYDLYLGTEWDCTHSHIGSYEEALNEGIKEALKYI